MENEPPLPPAPAAPEPRNKWLRLGRKILLGALITWCINFVLLKTGWDSWETFSKQADNFAESMMDASFRLSPMNLWNSLKSEQKTYTIDHSESRYFGKYVETGRLTVKDKIFNWLGYYWYTEKGNAFWVGRIILVIALLVGIGISAENYKTDNGFMETILFPFNVLWRTLFFLLGLGLVAMLLYLLIKILLAIVGGLVIIFSTIAAGGGIIKLVLDEAKGEAADSSKKTIAASILPLFLGKKKKK